VALVLAELMMMLDSIILSPVTWSMKKQQPNSINIHLSLAAKELLMEGELDEVIVSVIDTELLQQLTADTGIIRKSQDCLNFFPLPDICWTKAFEDRLDEALNLHLNGRLEHLGSTHHCPSSLDLLKSID
jgi:hypothetical protein